MSTSAHDHIMQLKANLIMKCPFEIQKDEAVKRRAQIFSLERRARFEKSD